MGRRVKLSSKPVRKARREASKSRRSITAQVEHWASLGCMAAERKLGFLKGPRYESDPANPHGVVEVHDDGRRIFGRWDMKLNAFVPAPARARRRK